MKATFERVGLDLWGKVQQISDQRFAGRYTKAKRDFAFSGLISCGHCGCALVGELKKGRYVYYHCAGYKGKCPESYTREEVLEKLFADLLKDLVFDDEVLDWVAEAMRQSHEDGSVFTTKPSATFRPNAPGYKTA